MKKGLRVVEDKEQEYFLTKDVDSPEFHAYAEKMYPSSIVMQHRWVEAVRWLRSKNSRKGWVLDRPLPSTP